MASDGPRSGSSASGTAWNNTFRVHSSDNNYGEFNLASNGATSHTLTVTGFSFAIPTGATIDGIVVEIEGYRINVNDCRDVTIQMVKGGSQVGSNYANTTTDWPTSDSGNYRTYGGANDLWGTTWTESDVEASNFGVALAFKNMQSPSPGSGSAIEIDHVRITVYYSTGGGGGKARPMFRRRTRRFRQPF